jgi:hypothetical protein
MMLIRQLGDCQPLPTNTMIMGYDAGPTGELQRWGQGGQRAKIQALDSSWKRFAGIPGMEIAAFGSWKTEQKTGQLGSWHKADQKNKHFEFRSNFWKNIIHNQFHNFLLGLYHSQHSSRGYIPTYGDDDHSFFGTENAPASRDLTLNNGGYFFNVV